MIVAISATRAENLRETVAALEGSAARVLPLVLDLRAQASIERAVHEIVAAFGRLDVLVNNAGTNLRALAVDVTRRAVGRDDDTSTSPARSS